jgi:AraC-like DNA-binding protein
VFESKTVPEYTTLVRGRLARWQANRAMSYVDAHVDARLKVSEIANVVHLSSSHFSRAFKRTFGMTVHAWVMRRRIEMAQTLMLNTSQKLSEIALRCGLSDQSHLTRWFRRVVGETPGSWRRERYEPRIRPLDVMPLDVECEPRSTTMSARHEVEHPR